jgi:hypothetical protein
MNDSPNGWPDPSKPGAPLHPERDGAHWIVRDGRIVPARWTAGNEAWRPADKCTPFAGYSAHGPTVARWRYLGPCLTPAEVAAALAAQAMAMRLRAAEHVEALREWGGQDYYCDSCKGGAIYPDREDVGRAIRALPLPDTSVLDAMLAEAKREGMREAAGIAVALAVGDEIMFADEVAAAIYTALAAAKEPAP